MKCASLDPLISKELEILGKKTSDCIKETKEFLELNEEITLMDHLSLLVLQIDQILLYIENKGNLYLEYQIFQEDFENLSRKQEKLRLNEKTKYKAEEMEEEVDQFEKDYLKSKEIFEKIQKQIPKEVKKFQNEKEKEISSSLIQFLELQKKILKKIKELK